MANELMLLGAGNSGGGGLPPVSSTAQLWLDASQLNLSDNTPVSTWTDKSGQGRDFTQAGAARPTFKVNIVNGKPIVRFDGSTSSMTFGSWPTGLASGECFWVLKNVNDPAVSNNCLHTLTGDNANAEQFPATDSNIYEHFGSTARKLTGNPTPSLSSTFRLYNVSSAANAFTNRVDTTQIFTTATNTVGWLAASAIGTNQGGFWAGDIAELIIYTPTLSSSDRAVIEQYLKAKYALTGY